MATTFECKECDYSWTSNANQVDCPKCGSIKSIIIGEDDDPVIHEDTDGADDWDDEEDEWEDDYDEEDDYVWGDDESTW